MVYFQLSLQAIDLSVQLLRAVSRGIHHVYNDGLVPLENMAPLVTMVTSNIIDKMTQLGNTNQSLVNIYEKIVTECISLADNAVQVSVLK